MGNIIQIKHGSGKPTGKLQPYELGYSDDGCLYIGTEENTATKLSSPGVMGLINSSNYLVLPTITNANKNTKKFLVCDDNNQIKFRTDANVLNDIGALSTSGGTVSGNLTVNGNLTGKLIVSDGNWGTSAPAGTGVNGQLYFVLV